MKMSKIKKMKMPEKKGEDMAGMDMEAMQGEADMEGEPMSEEMGEMSSPEGDIDDMSASPAALEAVSDDELMAEMKKRGLMAQMDEEQAPESDMPEEMV